jgi:biopolymer transport protein TolR
MAGRRVGRRLMGEINVVPYIDVMLVLLVIFMITAPLLAQGVKVELPQASANPIDQEAKEPLVVSVDAEGKLYLNLGEHEEQPVEDEDLVRRARLILKQQPDVPVLVRGDKDAAYGYVVYAMTLLQQAGAPSVGLLTQPPDKPSRRR